MASNKFNIPTFKKLSFNRLNKNLRWVNISPSDWVDSESHDVELTVVFADPKIKPEKIIMKDISGNIVETYCEKVENLSGNLEKFNSIPEDWKNFFKVRFTYNEHEVLIGQCCDEKNNLYDLFCLSAKLIAPTFLFDILYSNVPYFKDVDFESFVETGTLYAHTTIHASHLFKNVFTIELDDVLFNRAKLISDGIRNIIPIHGNSGEKLESLCNILSGPTVFFLDAHWSGDKSVNWEKSKFEGFPTATAHLGKANQTPNSQEQVPLAEELKTILEKFPYEAIIIIDDWQSIGLKNFAFEGEDWSHLSKDKIEGTFTNKRRLLFHYPYDQKHYVIGINAQRPTEIELGAKIIR